jgi:hypothetical protein
LLHAGRPVIVILTFPSSAQHSTPLQKLKYHTLELSVYTQSASIYSNCSAGSGQSSSSSSTHRGGEIRRG